VGGFRPSAATDRWDTALLISGDSDLCPAVRSVHRLAPDKRVVAAFPPQRHSDELRRTVHAAFTIGLAKIRQSQLPATVTGADGVILRRPPYWQ
jgi:uncharacterized LabA/DUF88 family protein